MNTAQQQPYYTPNYGAPMDNGIALYKDDFNNVLTDNALTWQKECQFAEQVLAKNDYLAKAAKAQPNSLRAAIINVAAIGISLNPALKHAYLVPRRLNTNGPQMVCLDISYQGLLALAIKERSISWGQAKLVHKDDTYQNNGADKEPTHQYQAFGERGPVIGAYCTVKLPSGDYLTEEMSVGEIQMVANTSMAANGPWKKWWGQMARKTVIKRASNYWPKCVKVMEAVAVLNQHEGIDFEQAEVVEPVATESTTLNELLEKPEEDTSTIDIELAIQGAKTCKELKAAGTPIARLNDGEEKNRLKTVWFNRKKELSQ